MKARKMKRQISQLATYALTMLASAVAQAAVQPDAGQIMRDVQQKPALSVPQSISPLRIDGEPVNGDLEDQSVLVKVKSFLFSGNALFQTEQLQPILADLAGRECSLKELKAGMALISTFYRAQGYLVARAYLPEQDIKDGVVSVKILEGLLDKQQLKNDSRLSDDKAKGYLHHLASGSALQAQSVDRALLLLGDTPGVGQIRAGLQPGASVGTTDLLVELDTSAPYFATVELDNYGNRYTGVYRLGGSLAINSPAGSGDLLTLKVLSSGADMNYARLAYQIPVGQDGLKLGAAYADTRYALGKEFAGLQAHGTASSASVYTTYPFIRSQQSNLSFTFTLEDKKLVDQTDVPISIADKQIKLASLGLAGNNEDSFLSGGSTLADVTLTSGSLSMDAMSLSGDKADTNGAYNKFNYNINRLQRLTADSLLSFTLSGQQTGKNLNSSEKFTLGGANGVRAYPQGEGNGDQGWLTSMELRHPLLDKVQGIVFYDAGSVQINHNNFSVLPNTRNIAGAGFGVNAKYSWAQLKTSIAWPTSGGTPLSVPASVNSKPVIWAQLAGQF